MKLLVKTVASTAVVLVTLAGCASRSSGGSGSAAAGSGSDASSSAPASGTTSTENGSQPPAPGSGATSSSGGNSGADSGGQPSAPGSQSSPAKPDPSAQVKYISPQGVTLGADGITLVADVSWGGCSDQPQLVVMSQDASKVVVELKTTSHARIGVMCPDIARTGEASVKLAAPLGSRQVIDGIKNAPINVH